MKKSALNVHIMLITAIHSSPGTKIPGPNTKIGVFGHVLRYIYQIGTDDFLSTGLYQSQGLIILIIIYV